MKTWGKSAAAPRPHMHTLRTLRERQYALLVLCAGTLMIILDGSVVNVALPSIKSGLDFSQANLAWVVNAYLIAFGGLLLLSGRLGDLFGRKRLFLGGLTLFTFASLLCGLAANQEMLIGARFLQGVGGAAASAVALGMIITMFPKPHEQAKAIAVYAFVAAAGASIGLIVGGLLTEAFTWHWIFFVNIPIGIATFAFAARLLDENERDTDDGADIPGAALITGGLMLCVYTIVQAGDHGWGSPRTLTLAAVTLALLAGFVAWQRRARSPLVPLDIFRARNVSAANLVQILLIIGLAAMFFLGALYMQQVLQYGVLEVGLAFLPAAIAIATISLKGAPRLLKDYEPRAILVFGLLLIVAGLAMFAQVPVDGDYVRDILPVMLLLGCGAGICTPAVLTMAMSGATEDDAGLRSGLVNTTLQIGPALGLAVLATLSSGRTEDLIKSGEEPVSALTSGFHLAFWVAAGLAVAAILLSITTLKSAIPHTAPDDLDDTKLDHGGDDDPAGVENPDYLALGLGVTNMMGMLWSIAQGRRAVGVELRGDPSLGLQEWNLREEVYHHLAVIDEMMIERYGVDRIPRRGDGGLYLLSECFYNREVKVGDATADELLSGFDKNGHIAGAVQHLEYIDDRWRDGEPHRVVTVLEPQELPEAPDPSRLDEPLVDVLERPSPFSAPAAELMTLMRRYLEEMERMDLEAGCEPRLRLFMNHRVVDVPHEEDVVWWRRLVAKRLVARDGFLDAGEGRKRIRIERIIELDYKGKFRRVRARGTQPIDIGVPELFVVAQGAEYRDASRLGFEQEDALIDHGDGRGPQVAQAEYLAGLLDVLVEGRHRSRIASEFDAEGNEYWVRQVAIGHEDDAEVGWVLVQVPEFMTFDPILAKLVPVGTSRDSAEYFAAYKHLLRRYFLDQASLVLEIPERDLDDVQLIYGPKLFEVVRRCGKDALVAANGVVAGDTFGNGHVLTTSGAMAGMLGHALRVRRYWESRDAGTPQPEAIRALADAIKEDTQALLHVSTKEFVEPPVPAPTTAEERKARAATEAVIAETRSHRRSFVSKTHADDWLRILIHQGRLHSYSLPPVLEEHPALRPEYYGRRVLERPEYAGLRLAYSKNVRLARRADEDPAPTTS